MAKEYGEYIQQQIALLKEEGLYKSERIICTQQQAEIGVVNGCEKKVLNFCANNYLGLANHPELIRAGQEALEKYGYGLASVRFICGTQNIHKILEQHISEFLGTEETILYSSCFDANGGLFETLLTEEDAVISDELNHASIIDGIRLSKAKRFRYKNNNMADLEEQLKAAASCRFKLIATDGVFSMDGIIANLQGICELATKYHALVMVDDSHAVGLMGVTGKGTPEHCGVADKVDIYTGTLGKALGGASGGYTSGKKEVIEWLRNRSRPYLFSNTLAPAIVGGSLSVLELLKTDGDILRKKLQDNSRYFRKKMTALGFKLVPGEHPIIPVMLGEAKLAAQLAEELLKENIYVIGFSFPVVPRGAARIRTQMSAAHSLEQIDKAVNAFEKTGRKLGII